jgi:hypothetical protein
VLIWAIWYNTILYSQIRFSAIKNRLDSGFF